MKFKLGSTWLEEGGGDGGECDSKKNYRKTNNLFFKRLVKEVRGVPRWKGNQEMCPTSWSKG